MDTPLAELTELVAADGILVLRLMPIWGHTAETVVDDVIRDYLNVFRTVRLRGTTIKKAGLAPHAVLLLQPLALLAIPTSHEAYLNFVGAKTRNMIRKAERSGYEFREFVWNDHLDEIFEINTSKQMRSSGEMHGWYTEPVKPRDHGIGGEYYKYYGVFKDGCLRGYLHIVAAGELAFFRHFIGHAQHLTNGIMNGLLSWAVQEYVGKAPVRWFGYGSFHERSSAASVYSFKKHAGFTGYAVCFDLGDDQSLMECAHRVRLPSTWCV